MSELPAYTTKAPIRTPLWRWQLFFVAAGAMALGPTLTLGAARVRFLAGTWLIALYATASLALSLFRLVTDSNAGRSAHVSRTSLRAIVNFAPGTLPINTSPSVAMSSMCSTSTGSTQEIFSTRRSTNVVVVIVQSRDEQRDDLEPELLLREQS